MDEFADYEFFRFELCKITSEISDLNEGECTMAALTQNKSILSWLDEKVDLLKPEQVVWIDGSEEQLEALRKERAKAAKW